MDLIGALYIKHLKAYVERNDIDSEFVKQLVHDIILTNGAIM